ncbi:hypothetical protein PNOK_0028900 [Pyrrhoderma noxium]|uniref:Nucleolus and neural progenitor protein-like N-terminal domain-containing protein n=1 Tax=Pyrrhoderma noxium TaxID=2282107 RepID=A0A286UUG8_9AGAM|nr:hypothetical protein PNOK_0028900 [Pyrrhoderma noxium]
MPKATAATARRPSCPRFSYTQRSDIPQAIHGTVDVVLKSLRSYARQITPVELSLSDELRILERLYYKSVNQHRSALFFQKVEEVRRTGNRILEVNIGGMIEDLRYAFYIGKGIERNPKALKGAWTQLPEVKFVNFLYERMSEITALLLRARERLAKAYHSLSLMLQTGAFLHLILTFTSITARLDSIVIEVISIVESLKEVLHNLLEAMGESSGKRLGKARKGPKVLPTLQPLQELTRTPNDTSMNELLDEDLGSAVIRRETLPQNALNNSEEWGDIGDPFHTQDKSMTNEAESVIVAKVTNRKGDVHLAINFNRETSNEDPRESLRSNVKARKKKKKRDVIDDIFGSL